MATKLAMAVGMGAPMPVPLLDGAATDASARRPVSDPVTTFWLSSDQPPDALPGRFVPRQ